MWKQHYFGALKFSLDQDSQMPVQYKCVCSSIYLQDYCKAEAACFFLKYSRNTSSTTPLKGVVLMRQISWYPVLSLLLSLAVLFLALPFAGSDASECSAPTSNARRHPKSFWSGLWNWNKLSWSSWDQQDMGKKAGVYSWDRQDSFLTKMKKMNLKDTSQTKAVFQYCHRKSHPMVKPLPVATLIQKFYLSFDI